MYSGNDDMIVPMLALGASGVISVLANVAPRETHRMVTDFLEGRVKEARDLQLKLLEVTNDHPGEGSPQPDGQGRRRLPSSPLPDDGSPPRDAPPLDGGCGPDLRPNPLR